MILYNIILINYKIYLHDDIVSWFKLQVFSGVHRDFEWVGEGYK